jgi:hypothetical protein
MRHIVAILVVVCATLMITGVGVWFSFPETEKSYAFSFKPRLVIPKTQSSHDEDGDGINDTQDLLDGARAEVKRKPVYLSSYYQGGYPPDGEGVCTDLVWRAMKDAGYDLKQMVDADIARRKSAYPRVGERPDPNIDFRRVFNLDVFFRKYATSLTIEVKPNDPENLKEWQGGDLVLFDGPTSHIGIVSDRRDAEGVPYLIHNAGDATEDDGLRYWPEYVTPVIGHYRWPKE